MADSNNLGGICYLEALSLILIHLKLAGSITWSWIFVLSPLILHCVLSVVPMSIAEYYVKKKGV